MSPHHAEDIHAVIQALKKNFDLPVWAIGTSTGTFSASKAAVRLGSAVNGPVLTSCITRSRINWDICTSHPYAIINMDLGKNAVPTLIVAHKDDGCDIAPAAEAEMLKHAFTNALKVEA